VTVTASLLLAVYAVVNGNEAGWTSAQTLTLLGAAAGLLALFLALETWVRDPLMPLRLFRLRSVATANVVGILWSAAMFAWFFVSALYLQLVLATARCSGPRLPSGQPHYGGVFTGPLSQNGDALRHPRAARGPASRSRPRDSRSSRCRR